MALNLVNLPRKDVLVHLVDKKPGNYFDDEVNVYVDGGITPGGGVSQSYVDEHDKSTLQAAKDYTDAELAKAAVTKLYTDFGNNEDGAVTQKFFTEQFNSLSSAKNLPGKVFYDIDSVIYQSDSVTVNYATKDLVSGAESTKDLVLSAATTGQAGVMTKAQVEALEKAVRDIESIEDSKQDKLVSGVNLKTVNHETLLGEGNIDIEGGEPDAITPEEFNNIWETA